MAGLAPDARSRFAARLKRLRLQRGFERARFFARSLGIEENRYTRYERAEVEPSLTLLEKICDVLHVSPNELLGFGAGSAETTRGADPPPEAEHGHREAMAALTWRLASAVVLLRHELPARGKPNADALEVVADTAGLFAELEDKPFATVAAIARDPYLKGAAADRRAAIAELIQAFTERLTAAVA